MNIDRIIENVLRQELLVEGTHVKKYRQRAVDVLLGKGVPEKMAKEWEETFFNNHFHGMPNNIVRLESLFTSAAADVGFDHDKLNRLYDILAFIKKNYKRDGFYDISKLDSKNASTYQDFENLFGKMMDEEGKNDEALANSYGEESQMNGDYSVVNVKTFDEAFEIGQYSGLDDKPSSRLCFSIDEGTWNKYTKRGTNECYVILRKGWKEMNPNDYLDDPNRPFDEYGLSMIFLFIDPNGNIATSNTRWNHEHGGKYTGDVDQSFTKGYISKLLGVNFNNTFKPNNTWEENVKQLLNRVRNGEDPNNVFDDCGKFKDGFAAVVYNDKINYISNDGKLLSKKWFDDGDDFKEGLASVGLKGKWNYINTNGEIISPNLWFDWNNDFVYGFGKVQIKQKQNFIKKNGELLTDQWFDQCDYFINGYAIVKLDGQYFYLDKNGNLSNNKTKVSESRMNNIIRESIWTTLRNLL